MGNPVKVLAVDDEKDVLFIVSAALKAEGYSVATASNGFEALEQASKECPDIIVLDVMMPKMDGFETLVKLREMDATRNVPVVMLTGLSERDKKLDAIDHGVQHYIVKPFEVHDLIAKLQNALAESKRAEEELPDFDE
ncbi:response regulator [Candidatus Sumerlaeota bacterium]|nr:response regulator [Candidatus Sumerlaeota bacterium]